jgi:predicted RNA-binding protein YlxR (DUF448 family)
MREHQIRSCAVCRKREPQDVLFRISFSERGLVLNEERGHGGRGVYVHRTISCTAKPMEIGRISRALRLSSGVLQKQMIDAIWNQMHQEVLTTVTSV